MEYCNGFMFDRENMLMVLKNRPAFQAGLYNGIGGKLEPGELPVEAMVREFEEESGVRTRYHQWEPTVELVGPDFTVHFFRCFVDKLPDYRTVTDEPIIAIPIENIRKGMVPVLDNMHWILPMQLHRNIVFPLRVQWQR